jgi:hypothetical protein
MTNEANAAIAGAVEAGATGILVNDSHWLMRNLLAEELNPEAELMSGGPKRLSMMEGIDRGFDAAMFIGYHARAGTRYATIDHTYTSRVYEARINGQPVGELALNAAMAGLGTVDRLRTDPCGLRSGAPAKARPVHLQAAAPAGGGFYRQSDGGHGGAGAGVQPDGRTDGQLCG